ncbi:uncharacterized protein LOC106072334 [Biomphalaria glabrata]|uniref:Uncharacterized protein LOC106072334 n=1 Tax=Biomphalaria glabrata TaxID=6526 RepID=A0A9U8EI69_BIOGL|nr:uncharacterized protein LOC106072334 [Biomphalaria glabrata]
MEWTALFLLIAMFSGFSMLLTLDVHLHFDMGRPSEDFKFKDMFKLFHPSTTPKTPDNFTNICPFTKYQDELSHYGTLDDFSSNSRDTAMFASGPVCRTDAKRRKSRIKSFLVEISWLKVPWPTVVTAVIYGVVTAVLTYHAYAQVSSVVKETFSYL